MPHAYVVYDHARPKNVATIRDWLAEQDILLAGRYSEWEYYNSDHAFLAGKKAAEQVRESRGPSPALLRPEPRTSPGRDADGTAPGRSMPRSVAVPRADDHRRA